MPKSRRIQRNAGALKTSHLVLKYCWPGVPVRWKSLKWLKFNLSVVIVSPFREPVGGVPVVINDGDGWRNVGLRCGLFDGPSSRQDRGKRQAGLQKRPGPHVQNPCVDALLDRKFDSDARGGKTAPCAGSKCYLCLRSLSIALPPVSGDVLTCLERVGGKRSRGICMKLLSPQA